MVSERSALGPSPRFEDFHSEVQLAAPLFQGGHLQEAVRKAAERYINRVSQQTGRWDISGIDLMNHVFSSDKPLLVFSAQRQSLTDRSRHDGYRSLAVGLTAAVRNVYTHEDYVAVSETEALEWLGFISAMHRSLDRTEDFVPVSEGEESRIDDTRSS